MNTLQKYLSTCLLATAALLVGASPALSDGKKSDGKKSAQVSLGTASSFAVLSGGALTCSTSTVEGDVGAAGAFTNTGPCTITGGMPPATDGRVAQALTDFRSAYADLQTRNCTGTLLSTITGPVTLGPGVYCTDAALTGAGVLTLDGRGDPNAVWIFKIGAALTGTNFTVTMAGGGQACNVFWAPGADVEFTTSAIKGNILAGDLPGGAVTGSITLTGGTLIGRALANVAVSMTNATVTGCGAQSGDLVCKVKDRDDDDDDDDKKRRKDKDKEHKSPWSKDENDGKDGRSGSW